MVLASTPEQPLPVRTVARSIGEWIGRLGRVWIEGQVTEISRRSGAAGVYLTLRDPVAEVSLRVTCARAVWEALVPAPTDGARVVVWAKPDFYLARGTLTLTAYDIRLVGVGDLLARIERLKGILAAEGLFAPERKRALPFLPRVVGLVCGRASAAERDVLENARRRWPGVRFTVRAVPVQGPAAVTEVTAAVRALDRDPDVDVVVVARGGGSVEDLLPFSDESLCRAVAACRTPVVSAIGHESDVPLLDLVADVRASTPTDAGKLVVPDVAEELARVRAVRDRARRSVAIPIERGSAALAALRSRPALADPLGQLERGATEVLQLRDRARRCTGTALSAAGNDLTHTRARVASLSPGATLARGYAVLQRGNGVVVRRPDEVTAGEELAARLAEGGLTVTVVSTQ